MPTCAQPVQSGAPSRMARKEAASPPKPASPARPAPGVLSTKGSRNTPVPASRSQVRRARGSMGSQSPSPPTRAHRPDGMNPVGPRVRRQHRRGRAGARAAGPRRAPGGDRAPADRRGGGAADLRRAGRRDDHVHGHHLLGGVRGRADPDVVVLPEARGAAAAGSGSDAGLAFPTATYALFVERQPRWSGSRAGDAARLRCDLRLPRRDRNAGGDCRPRRRRRADGRAAPGLPPRRLQAPPRDRARSRRRPRRGGAQPLRRARQR
jgi:hypothetical protein